MCYDNLDFTNNVRDQAMGVTPQLEHWTNAYGFISPAISATTCPNQTQLQHGKHLPFSDVARAFLDAADHLAVWPKHLLYRAVDHVAREAFRGVLRKNKIEFPQPSTESCLPSGKATIIHFAAIDANSGSIDGTYRVHRHLIKSELGWDTENDRLPIFHSRLHLVCGNQKTVENILATKIDQQESISLYERRRWMLPTPGLFHIQMNLAGVALRKHWAPIESQNGQRTDTRHALLRDVQFLGYKGLSPERSPWHTLDSLISTSFNSRVLAVWLQCLENNGFITKAEINGVESLQLLIRDRIEFD